MPLHTVSATFKDDAGSVPLSATVYNVAEEVNTLLLVPAGSTDTPFVIEFQHAKVNDYVIAVVQQSPAQLLAGTYSEPTVGTIGLKWNSTSVPVPNMSVVARRPHVFAGAIAGTTNEFSDDVTIVYATNGGTSDLSVVIKIGLNT